MPEVADRIPTDFDHHINGTAALAADKASYYASESISLYYREIEKHLKSQKQHENTQYIPDLYKIASDFKQFRRDYLTLVRQVASWMSLVHMLAVPPYRKLIGTEIKRKIIIEILQPYKKQPDLNGLNKILEQIKTILYNLRDTINLPYKTYKILLNKKQENPNLPVTLALPGNIQPDDQITRTIVEILDTYTKIILEKTPFTTIIDSLELLEKDIENEPNKIRIMLETLIIYLLKYKFIGSLLGLAITINEILNNTLNLLDKLDLYLDKEEQKNSRNLEIISPSEAVNSIINYMNELSIAQQAFIASILYNITTHTYFTIQNNNIIILDIMKHKILTLSIPCCILKYIKEDNNIKQSKILEELILNDLINTIESQEKMTLKNNSELKNCLKYDFIFNNRLNVSVPFLLTLDKFIYFESEALKSSYIQDILSKLYEDMWQGLQPLMVDIQEHGLLIDPRFTDKLIHTEDTLITILDNVMVLLDSIIDQSYHYYRIKNIINEINIIILSYLYYKWIHNTLTILIKLIKDNLRKLKIIHKYYIEIHENRKELSPPIKNIIDLILILEYNIKKILELLISYNNLINSILYKIFNKYKDIFLHSMPLLKHVADLPLEQVDNHFLGKLILKHHHKKREKYYIYKIIVRSDKLLQYLIQKKYSNQRILKQFHHNLLKILSFMIYIDTNNQTSPNDGKDILEIYLSKKLKKIDKRVEKVYIYIPIKGILKLSYHHAGRLQKPKLVSEPVEESTMISVPFHMIVLIISKEQLDKSFVWEHLKERIENTLAEEITRILELHLLLEQTL